MPHPSEELSRIRDELEAQNRDWQRCCKELAALGDVQLLIPQSRLDEIDETFALPTTNYQPFIRAYGPRA